MQEAELFSIAGVLARHQFGSPALDLASVISQREKKTEEFPLIVRDDWFHTRDDLGDYAGA